MSDHDDRSRDRDDRDDRGGGAPRGGGEEEGKLFVGNLSFDTENRDLEEAFGKFGKVLEARVITDRETQRSRGFAFVTFADGRDAEDAMKELQGVELQGRAIRIDRSSPRGSAPPPRGGPGGFRGGYDAPRGGYDAPRGGYDAPRGGYDAPRGGGYDAPRGGGGKGICYQYQSGSCRYGNDCRYSHDGPVSGGAPARGGYGGDRGGGGGGYGGRGDRDYR